MPPKETRLIAIDFDPETGVAEPVSIEAMWAETSGWTVPPAGMPARLIPGWRAKRKALIGAGVEPQEAWFGACKDAVSRERTTTRRRFFRA